MKTATAKILARIVRAERPPVVQIDTSVSAAYVQLAAGTKVARTEVVALKPRLVTIDLDTAGRVLGVEVIGAQDLAAESLLQLAGITLTPRRVLAQARYGPLGAPGAATARRAPAKPARRQPAAALPTEADTT